MAAGFFSKTLSTLLSTASRWVEFADGTTAPAHGAIATDPTSGLPLSVGSSGTDRSANKPTLPNVGANFAASGPYASYVLIKTIVASATRARLEVVNLSGDQIALVRDDGTAAAAAPPVNATVFALAGGQGEGAQGGSWSSQTFKGRLQVYAPSASAIVSIFED